MSLLPETRRLRIRLPAGPEVVRFATQATARTINERVLLTGVAFEVRNAEAVVTVYADRLAGQPRLYTRVDNGEQHFLRVPLYGEVDGAVLPDRLRERLDRRGWSS